MRKIISTLMLLVSMTAYAQRTDLHDSKVSEICSYIRTLHEHPEQYETVRKAMIKNRSWTMMSELPDGFTPESKSSICRLRDQVEHTGINDIAFQAEQERGSLPQSSNSFCNGNDPRYNHSFHEVKLLAGRSIASEISGGNEADNSGRKGRQLFLVVPFNPGTIKAEITLNGTVIPQEISADGVISFVIDTDVKPNDRIGIRISNISDRNQSAIIINHNSRKS